MKRFITTMLLCTTFLALSIFIQASFANAAATTDNAITVQTIPGESVTEVVVQKAHDTWPWYVVRGSGLVAAVSLVLLMLSGIGHITGATYRFLEPLNAWATHRALGIVFGITVLVHIFGLLFDHFLPFNIGEILIPWLSDYRPLHMFGISFGSLYVALGIIAFYLTVAIVITSLMIVEKQPKIWKFVHLLSYLTIVMVFVHALYIGTDTGHGWARVIWLSCAAGIVIAAVFRLRRAFTT